MTILTRELRDGQQIPTIGFGTYPLRGEAGASAVVTAIESGYRLLDTAFAYDNEGAVGEGIRRSGIDRADLFIASKLPGRYHDRPMADDAIRESIWRLGVEYLDLYLIHWPNPLRDLYLPAWEALVAAQEAGLIRSIGVSNFTEEHLQRIASATGVLPVVNQIELHPYFPQVEMVEAHQKLGIQTLSWSPLGKGSSPFGEAVIVAAADAHGVTPAQVVLRWQVQRGSVPIPKSANADRQRANLDVFGFELSAQEMAAITALGRPDGRLFDGDPNYHEEL